MLFSAPTKSLAIQITIVGSLFTLSTTSLSAAPASCPSPIPLGLTTALTGNLALLGTQARNGVEFAVDEINKNGGIAGTQLALATEDTGACSTDALNAANRIARLTVFHSRRSAIGARNSKPSHRCRHARCCTGAAA
jgi:ABC-type branched-subunit amino acid transport system substrate-binding protein